MNTILRYLLLLLIGVASSTAIAGGYYEVTYSAPESSHYCLFQGLFLSNRSVEGAPWGSGFDEIRGKITAHFEWRPNGSTDIHPSRVLIDQQCSASTDSPFGLIDNGLGDTSIVYQISAFVGVDLYFNLLHHYSVISDSTGSFDVECTPYASAPAEYGSYSFCQVFYRASYISAGNANVTVSYSTSRVSGLTFNSTKKRQEAAFTIKATAKQANEQPFPANSQINYAWSTASSGDSLEFSDAKAQTTVAYATKPLKAYPVCTVVVVDPSGNYYTGYDSRSCAAIGGPITVTSKKPSDRATKMYEHDQNDPTKPFYLTNYGYDPAASLPSLSQPAQFARLAVLLQPLGSGYGTVVSWELPPEIYKVSADAGGTVIDAYAKTDFQAAVPKAKFVYTDPSIPGGPFTFYDDSADTQALKEGTSTWVALVYKLSGHKPKELVDETAFRIAFRPPNGATAMAGKMTYSYRLLDTAMDPMPGVWVQERFISSLPAGFVKNDLNQFWTTASPFSLTVPGMVPGDGRFNLPDNLWAYWTVANPTTFVATHIYFAGTQDPNPSLTTGVKLATYKITYVPGLSGSSTPLSPGSATQEKQP